MARKSNEGGPTVIKKYANRRLYNTGTSSYITLDDIAEMVRDEVDFLVLDAKSGEDITHQILAQIILDQESSGDAHLLPVSFLRDLIGDILVSGHLLVCHRHPVVLCFLAYA